jgi:hypothetical protein
MTRLLSETTVQEIQLELLRRTEIEALNGQKIHDSLLKHRALWTAVMLDRFVLDNGRKLPSLGLMKLRNLPDDYWNADTLYILTPDIASARRLAEIAEEEHWGGLVRVHDDSHEVCMALGSFRDEKQAVVSIWWD